MNNELHMSQRATTAKVSCILGCIRKRTASTWREVMVLSLWHLLRPPLEFWAPWNGRDIDKAERVQWMGTKMIRRLEHMMYKERLGDVLASSQEEKDNVTGESYCCL